MEFNQNKIILGTGLAFPVQTNARGEIELVSSEKDIQQSIKIILGTRPGERVMRPTFGCRAHDMLFEPRDATTSSMIKKYVEEALSFWEPRIQVLAVNTSIADDPDGSILVEIEYQIKSSHDTRSIVYPFFLSNEEE
jgi:phage baseplate assembly protein W